MLTPQEVREKKFRQSFMLGYEMSSVDDFLEALTNDFTTLFKENATLKNKIRVLVDKLEEYRAVDDQMRKALLEAQRMTEETRQKSEQVMLGVTSEADDRRAEIEKQLQIEQKRLDDTKDQTLLFVRSLRQVYQGQLEQLDRIVTFAPPEPDTPRDTEAETADEIEKAVMAQVAEAIHESEALDQNTTANAEVQSALADASVPDVAPEQVNIAATIRLPTGGALQSSETSPFESFEVNFGTGEPTAWKVQQDTVVPAPKYEFPHLEDEFGHKEQKTG